MPGTLRRTLVELLAHLGRYELRSLRDKDGREADFLVVKDGRPWFIVAVAVTPQVRGPQAYSYAATLAPANCSPRNRTYPREAAPSSCRRTLRSSWRIDASNSSAE